MAKSLADGGLFGASDSTERQLQHLIATEALIDSIPSFGARQNVDESMVSR